MLFPISELIKDRSLPLCIRKGTKVREALEIMMEHDYSQLPIVDEQGVLAGIITEQTITYTYYLVGNSESLLDMTVDHCQATPVTLSPDDSIFDALDKLRNVYAAVVVVNHKPTGIVTDYDTTFFFRNYSDGLIQVQDVEITLRQHIESILNTEQKMKSALCHAFGQDRRDPSKLAKEFDKLDLGDTIQLITTDENWGKFKPIFSSKPIFFGYMEPVREARNQLTHFRGNLTNLQKKQLKQALDWLAARPKIIPGEYVIELSTGYVNLTGSDATLTYTKGKYSTLVEWLSNEAKNNKNVKIKFGDIEKILGEPLTVSARNHRSWWSNDYSNAQAHAWIRAGWLVQSVDLSAEEVVFRQTIQALYMVFFSDMLERIKQERSGITRVQRVSSQQNWLSILDRGGCTFSWVLPKEELLRVEIYIGTEDKHKNKTIFDMLKRQKETIEGEIGEKLVWDELVDAKGSRIYIGTQFRVTHPLEEHEPAKRWGVEIMLKFLDTFQPRLSEL